jgi:HAMP domain-containing protein
MSTIQKQKGSLKQKILLTYAVLTIIALGSIASVAGIFIGVVGSTASSQTSAQLTAQVQYNMQNKTHQTAQVVKTQLNDAVNDLNSLATYIERLWAIPRSEIGNRKSYFHEDFIPAGTTLMNGTVTLVNLNYPQNIPPNTKYVLKYEHNVSFDYGSYLFWPSAYAHMNYNLSQMNSSCKDALDRSAFLDFPMGQLLKTKPQYTWIYMEFMDIGLDKSMPWTGTDMYVFPPESEDLRKEPYEANAVALQGQVYWTSPYNDPSGQGFMITISRAVYNGTRLIGVIAMDITINTIVATVGNIHIYNSGYGFLINSTGFVVSHPRYRPDADIQELENSSIPVVTLNSIESGQTGFAEITKLGKQWYLAYESIHVSDYAMGIMVPKDEALAPVQALQQQANLNLGIQLAIMLSILGVILVVSLWVGLTIANSVVQPIQRITNMALKLSTEDIKTTIKEFDNNFDREMKDEVQKDDEIGNLAKAFKNLVKAVQNEDDKGPNTGKET